MTPWKVLEQAWQKTGQDASGGGLCWASLRGTGTPSTSTWVLASQVCARVRADQVVHSRWCHNGKCEHFLKSHGTSPQSC